MTAKLSTYQRELLTCAATQTDKGLYIFAGCTPGYRLPTCQKLEAAGLLELVGEVGPHSTRFRITDAGRAALT